jgi:hypothetical protein
LILLPDVFDTFDASDTSDTSSPFTTAFNIYVGPIQPGKRAAYSRQQAAGLAKNHSVGFTSDREAAVAGG